MTPADLRETNENGGTKGASVIVNAIAVLRTFTADEPLLGVTEIAHRVGLHKSTVSRILATFEQEHLVERDAETRRFRLGLGLIAVAGPLLAELEERRVAYPVLRELTEQTGETSALMVWNGTESMCVEQIASPHQIKHTTPLGARYQGRHERLRAGLPLRRNRPNVSVRCCAAGPSPIRDWTTQASRPTRSGSRRCRAGAGPSTTGNPPSTKWVWQHPSMTTAAMSWPPVLVPAPRFRVSPERLQSLGEACAAAAHRVTTRLGGRAPGRTENRSQG